MRTWHIVTGEYQPRTGGVADYVAAVAGALASSGDAAHVWTAGDAGTTTTPALSVHRVLRDMAYPALAPLTGTFASLCRDDRVLVQWVPHAFGRRGVNLAFPAWLYRRSRRHRPQIDVMVHEPFLPLRGSPAQRAAAIAQRFMTGAVLRSASRVFVGTPAWIPMCRPLAPGASFRWIPIPSGVPPVATEADGRAFRDALKITSSETVVGVFGRPGPLQEAALVELARAAGAAGRRVRPLLIGLDSDRLASRLVARHRELGPLIVATGPVDAMTVSSALRGCDVMLQAYADGICTRHSSASALLAHALPIVANDGPFTEALWRDSRALRLVTQGPSELASAVLSLLGDDSERRRLSAAARDLYDARFDVRHTVAALRS